MPYPAALTDELAHSEPARAAMALIEASLARRSTSERGAFWHAIDLAYISRKAPPEPVAVPDDASMEPGDPTVAAG